MLKELRLLKSHKKRQLYNDGVASIYSVTNIAAPGNKSKDGLEIKAVDLRYSEEVVGITRFYNAKQAKITIHKLLRLPRRDIVSPLDVIIPIDDVQYTIVQIQYPQDVFPESMDLSLERIDSKYDINEST